MPTATQITRAALPNYQYLTPTVPEMQALGIQSPIILAEQLMINDRLRPDRYIITNIDGLRGSDVRDTRVPHPSAHGEVPYDAFWGGRTITFEGFMEAGNVAQLGKLERDLMAALGPLPAAALGSYYSQGIAAEYLTALQALPEFPVRFNWWDQRDAFYDSQSPVYWSQLTGAALSIPGTGRCTTVGGGATLSYHNLRSAFIDETVTASISVTPLGGANNIGVISGCTSDTSHLKAIVTWNGTSTWTLNLQAVQSTGTTTLASANLTAPSGQTTWWIQLVTISDLVTANLYSVDPRANPTATPFATCSATLTGAMSQQFGYGQPGFVGLIATSTANWCFLDWRVDALWPSDFLMSGRLIQSPQMSHKPQIVYDRFRRDFQFSIRASDPRILSPSSITVVVPVSTASYVALGRTYPRTYPLTYLVPLSEPTGAILNQQPSTGLEVNALNHGSWIAKPIITITGAVTNPIITNITTGQQMILDGTIGLNDYVVINCQTFTMVNKAGANVFQMFDPASSWLTLVPGDNLISLTGSGTASAPTASIKFNHAWI